jgi:hypothetical protein
VLWASLIFFLRQRIALAIGLIREAAAAIVAMPVLVIFPVLQTVI